MFILFVCAILWNIIDCSVTPPANFRAWDADNWRWWLKTTSSPFTFDRDYDVRRSNDMTVAIVVVLSILGMAAIFVACKCCQDCMSDDDESTSTSFPTLHPPPRRAVPQPLDRTPQTFRNTSTVNNYLQDGFPIQTTQSFPTSTGALSTNSILRVQLFSQSNTDSNSVVQSRNVDADKPPGYNDVIGSNAAASYFPIVTPSIPDSPPPRYDDHRY